MRLYGDIEERFLARVRFSDFCWEWTACRNPDGYGRVRIRGVEQFVHRAIVEWILQRKLSRHEIVNHLCRNHLCARPSHLEVVSPSENTRRGLAAKLSTEAANLLRQERRNGLTYMQLAKKFGVHYTAAIRICQRHHLRIDTELHVKHAASTRMRKKEKAGQSRMRFIE